MIIYSDIIFRFEWLGSNVVINCAVNKTNAVGDDNKKKVDPEKTMLQSKSGHKHFSRQNIIEYESNWNAQWKWLLIIQFIFQWGWCGATGKATMNVYKS